MIVIITKFHSQVSNRHKLFTLSLIVKNLTYHYMIKQKLVKFQLGHPNRRTSSVTL